MRPRDFAGALAEGRSLEPFIARLNEIRRLHPALQQLRTIHFHTVDNDALLSFSKFDAETGDCVLVVVTLNAFGPEEATLHLDMAALGMEPYERFWVRDEITGEEYQWGQSITSASTRAVPSPTSSTCRSYPRNPESRCYAGGDGK